MSISAKEQAWEDYCNSYLAFFWRGEGGIFSQKGRETLSRSQNDLNTADKNVGLLEMFSFAELHNMSMGI
jgi:hypothetical protein